MNPPNDFITEMMTGEDEQETEEEMEARIDAEEDYSSSSDED
jgi:hypothetical protein